MDPSLKKMRREVARAVQYERALAKMIMRLPEEQKAGKVAEYRIAFEDAKQKLRSFYRAMFGPDAPFPSDAQGWDDAAPLTTAAEESKVVVDLGKFQ